MGKPLRTVSAMTFVLLVCLPAQAQQSNPDAAVSEEAAEQEPVATIPVEERAETEPAPAASDATQLDTIEVTATKRLKAQRDIPGSVGALKGEYLEKIGAQDMRDYMKLIPGVSLSDIGGFADQRIPIIRGITVSANFSNNQLPTGIYVDDTPFTDLTPTLSVPDLNAFDLERVEVLKGPQGTLFGAGALAGAVRFVLNKPQLGLWEGRFTQTVKQVNGSDGLSPISAAALNVPLGDTAAIRAVGIYRREDGWVRDLKRGEDDINDLNQDNWRILGKWLVNDRLELSASHFDQYTEQTDDNFTTHPERFERSSVPFPQGPTFSELTGTNLTAGYDFDFGRLLLSSNYVTKNLRRYGQGLANGTGILLPEQVSNEPEDCNSACDFGTEDTPLPSGLSAFFFGEVEGYFHELRLSSPEGGESNWEWVAGAAFLDYESFLWQRTFTLRSEALDDTTGVVPPIEGPDTPVGPVSERQINLLDGKIDFQPTEKAVYGEVTRRLGPHWEVAAGGRAYELHSISDQDRQDLQSVLLPGNTSGEQTPGLRTQYHGESTERGFNPKFSVRYIHDRNMQGYLLAAKGFQFGGPQIQGVILGQQAALDAQNTFTPDSYKSSVLWNYEVGLRTEWLDRRMRFDVVFFYLDWKDLQLTQVVYLLPDGTRTTPDQNVNNLGGSAAVFIVGNVGSAHSEGVEVGFEMKPMPDLTFSSTAAWISALTDEPYFDPNVGTTFPGGTRLPVTPRFQIANVVAYTHRVPFTESWLAGMSLTHAHIGVGYTNFFQDNAVGGYDTLDAGLRLSSIDQRWFVPELNLNIINLTNVPGVGFADSNDRGFENRIPAYTLIRPRTGILALTWKF